MVIVFAAFAVVNTLTLATADRSREFAQLRLVGTTRKQVLAMMRWEALTVIALGTVLGTAVALTTLVPFSKGVTGSLVPTVPVVPCLALVGAAAVLGRVGTQLPARLVLRTEPIDAVGIRD
jgi:putative ABC transport system permease protein